MAEEAAGRRILAEILEDQALGVLAAVDDLRLAPEEALHDARVALRRLRSSLTGFRPLLDGDGLADLRRDLKWLGGELAGARDIQVTRQRVEKAFEWVPAGPESAELLERLDALAQESSQRAAAALADPRMSRLLARLQGMLLGQGKGSTGTRAVQEKVAVSLGDLLGRLGVLGEGEPEELHEVRKQAKRARSMLTAVADTDQVLPARSGAGRVLRRLHELQDSLGEHQDAVTSAALLREIAPSLVGAGSLATRIAAHEETEAVALRPRLQESAVRLEEAAQRLARRTPDVHLPPP